MGAGGLALTPVETLTTAARSLALRADRAAVVTRTADRKLIARESSHSSSGTSPKCTRAAPAFVHQDVEPAEDVEGTVHEAAGPVGGADVRGDEGRVLRC